MVRQHFCKYGILLAIFILVSACGGSTGEEQESYPRKLTQSETQSYSRIFNNNTKFKNAEFLSFAGTLPSHGFVAKGKVDWVSKTLSIDVSLFDTSIVDISAVVTPDGVYETYMEINKGYEGENIEPRQWVFRPLDSQSNAIDALAVAILGLGTETPENPLLLNQNGVRVWGTEKVGDEETTVYKGADARIYFVNRNDVMVRMKGELTGFKDEVTVQFSQRGRSDVNTPSSKSVYDVSEVAEWYFDLRPNF